MKILLIIVAVTVLLIVLPIDPRISIAMIGFIVIVTIGAKLGRAAIVILLLLVGFGLFAAMGG